MEFSNWIQPKFPACSIKTITQRGKSRSTLGICPTSGCCVFSPVAAFCLAAVSQPDCRNVCHFATIALKVADSAQLCTFQTNQANKHLQHLTRDALGNQRPSPPRHTRQAMTGYNSNRAGVCHARFVGSQVREVIRLFLNLSGISDEQTAIMISAGGN